MEPMNATEPLGHLSELGITGLFGNYDFSFRLDLKEPTLLTGTNGSGKSTVLRIINAVGTGAWGTLMRMPFRSASLSFEHGQNFSVLRVAPKQLEVRLNDNLFHIDRDDFDQSPVSILWVAARTNTVVDTSNTMKYSEC